MTTCSQPIRVEITGGLKKGEMNRLAVRVASPMFSVSMNDKTLTNWYTPRIFSRKAQFNYGWDIAPHLVSIGIWRPAYLDIVDAVAVRDAYVRTLKLDDNATRMAAVIALDGAGSDAEAQVEVFTPGGDTIVDTSKSVRGASTVRVPFTVKAPQLWWPNGLGNPSLYRIRITVRQNGETLDVCEQTFGIRTVETVEEQLSGEESNFYFKINGRKTFMKGINWTPADALPGTIPDEKYRTLVDLVKDTGANMMRVLGRGYLRTGPLLSALFRTRNPGVAGLHVFVWGLSRRSGVYQVGESGSGGGGAPLAFTCVSGLMVRRKRERRELWAPVQYRLECLAVHLRAPRPRHTAHSRQSVRPHRERAVYAPTRRQASLGAWD